jgi:L-rhamnose mutarotase
MIKRAFTMKLKPGGLAEYKKHHDNIWRELVEEIEKSGIGQITIFEADPVLFLYSEIYDEEAWDKLWGSEVHDRWSEVMNPLMEFRNDGIVDSSEVNLVFDLKTGAGS